MTYSETGATSTNDDSIILVINDSVVTDTALSLFQKINRVRTDALTMLLMIESWPQVVRKATEESLAKLTF